MPYTVQFVGLVCFYRESEAREALLPDGRNPIAGIDPHFASIVVRSDAIDEMSGWNGDADVAQGTFELVPCSISLEGADTPGPLDTSAQDDALPQLRRLDPNFEIDLNTAETIARLPIRQGTLAAYSVPGGTALISQLDVLHDGPITVTVTPLDGSEPKILRLKPGTEIAIANTARLYPNAAESGGHFRIYEKLSKNPVNLSAPPEVIDLEPSMSQHPVFGHKMPMNLNTDCSNTGCCRP